MVERMQYIGPHYPFQEDINEIPISQNKEN